MTVPHTSPPGIRALILIALLAIYNWNDRTGGASAKKNALPVQPSDQKDVVVLCAIDNLQYGLDVVVQTPQRIQVGCIRF